MRALRRECRGVLDIYRRLPGLRMFYDQAARRAHDLVLTRPDQLWVGDVTYLEVGSEWRYLATVLDRHSRRLLGCALGPDENSLLTLRAMRIALRARKPVPGTLFHGDRGAEFLSRGFTQCPHRAGFSQSINRPRRQNDNASMKSWSKTLKCNMYHRQKFTSDFELRLAVRDYIAFYNLERLDSALGYRSLDRVRESHPPTSGCPLLRRNSPVNHELPAGRAARAASSTLTRQRAAAHRHPSAPAERSAIR